jgi:XTP/dITP diphosphohydrolase
MAHSKTRQRLMLATGNPHKVEEIQAFLEASGLEIEVLSACSLEGLEENALTFAENALLKAKFVLEEAQAKQVDFTLGDDSGFVVEALSGHQGLDAFPGVWSNRWLAGDVTHADRCRGIYALMRGELNRNAYFVCGMALLEVSTNKVLQIEERCPLWVRDDEALVGSNGFGYDPMVHPVQADGTVLPFTMAELSMSEKNALSHRGRALAQLVNEMLKASAS